MTDTKQLVGLLRDCAEQGDPTDWQKMLRAAADTLEKSAEGVEPVAYVMTTGDGSIDWGEDCFSDCPDTGREPLYFTPPAPAVSVPDEITAAQAPRISHDRAIDYAQGWNDCRLVALAAAPQPESSRPLKEVVEDMERNPEFAAAIKDGRIWVKWVKSATQPEES